MTSNLKEGIEHLIEGTVLPKDGMSGVEEEAAKVKERVENLKDRMRVSLL